MGVVAPGEKKIKIITFEAEISKNLHLSSG